MGFELPRVAQLTPGELAIADQCEIRDGRVLYERGRGFVTVGDIRLGARYRR